MTSIRTSARSYGEAQEWGLMTVAREQLPFKRRLVKCGYVGREVSSNTRGASGNSGIRKVAVLQYINAHHEQPVEQTNAWVPTDLIALNGQFTGATQQSPSLKLHRALQPLASSSAGTILDRDRSRSTFNPFQTRLRDKRANTYYDLTVAVPSSSSYCLGPVVGSLLRAIRAMIRRGRLRELPRAHVAR